MGRIDIEAVHGNLRGECEKSQRICTNLFLKNIPRTLITFNLYCKITCFSLHTSFGQMEVIPISVTYILIQH